MTILNGTTAHDPRGAITTVIGPNGAGKSTMFKTIFGLLPVRTGRIMFDGAETTNFPPRQMLDAGVCYIPQGRNIFPELSVRHNLELGGVALPDRRRCWARSTAMMERFPMLREKARRAGRHAVRRPAEDARGRARPAARPQADPDRRAVDRPVADHGAEVFGILKDLRDKGVTILMIEQNAKQALQISDYGLVLEQGQTRIEDTAANILADPRIAQLFLGGGLQPGGAHDRRAGSARPARRQHQGSLSPAICADAFAAAGIDGYYHLMDIDRLPGRQLEDVSRPSATPVSWASTSRFPTSRRSSRCWTSIGPKPARSARSIPWSSRRMAARPATTSTGSASAQLRRSARPHRDRRATVVQIGAGGAGRAVACALMDLGRAASLFMTTTPPGAGARRPI